MSLFQYIFAVFLSLFQRIIRYFLSLFQHLTMQRYKKKRISANVFGKNLTFWMIFYEIFIEFEPKLAFLI